MGRPLTRLEIYRRALATAQRRAAFAHSAAFHARRAADDLRAAAKALDLSSEPLRIAVHQVVDEAATDSFELETSAWKGQRRLDDLLELTGASHA